MGKRDLPLCSSIEEHKRLTLGDSLRFGKRALADSISRGKKTPLGDTLRIGKRSLPDKRILLGDSLRVGKRDYPVFEWLDCIPDEFVLEEPEHVQVKGSI
jgi:hypothetical protein